jgi:hypothetical protein
MQSSSQFRAAHEKKKEKNPKREICSLRTANHTLAR